MNEKSKPKFKVVDKRTSAGGQEIRKERADTKEKKGESNIGQCGEKYPDKMDFVTFVLSMSQTALLNMGCGPNPETGKVECDLKSARCTIDILEVLQEKTKGNLTGEEERILERILTELRLMFVQKSRERSGKGND